MAHSEQVIVRNSAVEAEKPVDPPEFLAQFFTYDDLPARLAEVARPYCELAQVILMTVPRNQERTESLRKLMESRDAVLRAMVAK